MGDNQSTKPSSHKWVVQRKSQIVQSYRDIRLLSEEEVMQRQTFSIPLKYTLEEKNEMVSSIEKNLQDYLQFSSERCSVVPPNLLSLTQSWVSSFTRNGFGGVYITFRYVPTDMCMGKGPYPIGRNYTPDISDSLRNGFDTSVTPGVVFFSDGSTYKPSLKNTTPGKGEWFYWIPDGNHRLAASRNETKVMTLLSIEPFNDESNNRRIYFVPPLFNPPTFQI